MSRKQFKSSASAARALGTASPAFGFSSAHSFGSSSSTLSYLNELPDLSSITDAHVVVAFKNLTKRDATTKTKALEDLQTLLIESGKDVEDGVLDAWTNIYPRTSIDSARRVRQLAHALHGHIATKSGKRIAKHMPKIIGAFLAGQFDNDKAVARAASDSLNQIFNTSEKRQVLWKAYQDPLLDFAKNVFDNETPQTLSDQRSVSADEASAKYHRVVASAISLLSALLAALDEDDFNKKSSRYTELLQDKKLWENALSSDVAVRRSTHKLLRNVLQTRHVRPCLDMSLLAAIYISKCSDSDQSGSGGDYVESLIALTASDSKIWTDWWKDKMQPSSRLRALVKRGSQGAALNYWSAVLKLFNLLPNAALPSDVEKAQNLIKAFHSGITRKDEPRPYVVEGLKSYVHVAGILSTALTKDAQDQFLKESIWPLITQYVVPKAENAKWNVPANSASTLIQEILTEQALVAMMLSNISTLSAALVREIKLSLPETAQDYARSQDELSKTGERFASLLAALTPTSPSSAPESLEQASAEVLKEAFTVVTNRQGKPYGAAAVASAIVAQCQPLLASTSSLTSMVEDFLEGQIANIYVSPSFKQLTAILSACQKQNGLFRSAWRRCLTACTSTKSKQQYDMIAELLMCQDEVSEDDLEHLRPRLTPYMLSRVEQIWAGEKDWSSFLPLMANSYIAAELFAEPVLHRVATALVDVDSAAIALIGLRGIINTCPNILKSVLSSITTATNDLFPNLLLLTESPNIDHATEAQKLLPIVQGFIGSDLSSGSGAAVIDVIQNGLNTAGPSSVSVKTLFNHAKGMIVNKLAKTVDGLLPDVARWGETLAPFLSIPIDKSLAVTSPFGGAIFLTKQPPTLLTHAAERDAWNFSVPLRMAMFSTMLLKSLDNGTRELDEELIRLLIITTGLANDHLSIAGSSNLWSIDEPDLVNDVADFVSEAQRLLKSYYSRIGDGTSLAKLQPADLSLESYYLALFHGKMRAEAEETAGAAGCGVELEQEVKRLRLQDNTFGLISQLFGNQTSLADSSAVMRYCNELVADLTLMDTATLRGSGLAHLVILNNILTNYEDAVETIAKSRLSRFVSKAVSWLLDESVEDELVTELYRTLLHVLPLVSDMYGGYWKNVLESIKTSLELVSELPDANSTALIPVLHSALRLYATLRRINSSEVAKDEDERNDDVIEAWKEYEGQINVAMINCLKVPRLVSDEQHQPLMIFNELLSREIQRIPTSKLTEIEELYPQLYSPSPAVQQAAYRLFHRYIPSKQEQVSIDTVLEKRRAQLPDELLSLILEAPVAANLHDEDFERSTPPQLRGYLLSWLLVFDHFQNASHKVKNDYSENMKETSHIGDFLNFAFDFLGHSKGKPIDASKFDVASYNSSTMDDSPLKDTYWLLTHLYYLCLTYLPTLSKNWWIDCKSRQTVSSVETWTEKHISPLVISTALEVVATWAGTQESAHTSEEPPPLSIKINYRASELVAAYPVDDEGQVAQITISLPPTFPLHNAKVSSPSDQKAMAVDERRWNAWLLNSQVIIAFSNNSIVDGLLAWRRNVFGALKGQTECAICYSVVGEDGRVPSKKCRTCKNSFHGGCLFKWFKSSNGTTCPLCRESFNYY